VRHNLIWTNRSSPVPLHLNAEALPNQKSLP